MQAAQKQLGGLVGADHDAEPERNSLPIASAIARCVIASSRILAVVHERRVNHRIRAGDTTTEALGIGELAAVNLGSERRDRGRCCIRSREAEHRTPISAAAAPGREAVAPGAGHFVGVGIGIGVGTGWGWLGAAGGGPIVAVVVSRNTWFAPYLVISRRSPAPLISICTTAFQWSSTLTHAIVVGTSAAVWVHVRFST
jgi:hypothetical protein